MNTESRNSDLNVRRILDIELPITVCFGGTQRPLQEIMEMTPGTLLELDCAEEDGVTLQVNGRPFARGDVVVVDGYYAIKIRQIDSPEERIHTLGEAQ